MNTKRFIVSISIFTLVGFACLSLNSCGQKGALYIQEASTKKTAEASKDAEESTTEIEVTEEANTEK